VERWHWPGFWQTGAVHLLPADRAGHRIIDSETVCQAIAALGDPESVRARAGHYALLADPTRLTLLTCIHAAGPISVSDLAAAAGIHDTTVSQALRHLRATGVVTTQRDGRVIRYLLTGHPVSALLAQQQASRQPHARLPR
jgi:ArsR family transcriptional regulator, lead/cadmium/zinc/bismuth-responsive transcriptional repressor